MNKCLEQCTQRSVGLVLAEHFQLDDDRHAGVVETEDVNPAGTSVDSLSLEGDLVIHSASPTLIGR